MLLILSYFLLFFVRFSNCCFACGVCQPGLCGPPQPPPTPMCGGCSRGYACGSYGCYRMRARARSSKTLNLQEEEEKRAALIRLSPDEKFERCCVERNLPDSCMSKCSYQSYTRMALQNMYFKLDACPMQAAADIHFCAAQGKDHSTCCFQNGVTTTLAGPKCMTFCDQRPGHITQLDITYLACYDRFESMKSCFYYEMSNGNGANEPPASIPADPLLAENSQNVFQPKEQSARPRLENLLMNRDPSIGGELEIEDYDNDNVSAAPRARAVRRNPGIARTFIQ
ncbi:unnamed protein product, partial [Mesorhabditis belari]|uniref:Domain of unknown function DB domain-containing protein n=1 Tax=Mesorhabditis belari TaxID=2138241 RepID=A0AAF3EJD2_9BILA